MEHGVVVAKNITKIYGSGTNRVEALKGVNLNVQQGEFIAVLGPSGSGKTTLLNMLGALDRPTRGQVFIDNVETSRVAERNLYRIRRGKLGFIFQTYYLVPTLNAMQNVLMPVLPIRGNKRYEKRAQRLLDIVGLKDRTHHKPGELSGGEQQRVAIARALILNPPVVLADEPTGNLDTKTGAEIIDLMKRLNKERGKTFIIVTHDRRIADIAERALYLLDGELSDHLPEEY
ncbi:MAG: ATP-binding cassette domain-containing protein [Dehalococcoidia bacterium]|nr:ATP-binding cassette domain-containing protein [Dehalococcoidia bacterium]